MARRSQPQIEFDALALEGGLLPPEWLAKVAALEAPPQSPADYGIPKGLQLRDEIGRYWRIAEAIWAEFSASRGGADAVGAARRLARDLLVQAFGFGDLAAAAERTAGGRIFPIAFEAIGGRVPIIVGPHTEGLDQSVPRHGDGNRRRSAWGALQEYLNTADAALWGIVTNGLVLRLGRDNSSLTRPAWLEADLERIFTEQRFADFSVLWLLLHASRFGRAGQPVQEAPLERWREAGREEGSRARDALRLGVEEALRALGQGFLSHPENSALRAALASGDLTPAAYFNELLRLVYRTIFLLTVEERGILHMPGADPEAVRLYADGYGMRRLRERALRHTAHDRHGDLWASLRPVFAALGRAEGEPALGLPGLGGLFAPDQCPHLDPAALENRGLLTALFRLAWMREGHALARVNWKDMGVEEFGSVYESLLELVPVVSEGGRRFGFAGEGESAGNARKLTGSYYTPDALVQQLLDTALEPVVAQRLAESPDPKDAERALLCLSVVDPACGSGHFLLAAARRLAGHLARLRAGGTPGAVEYRHALREVVTHCVYGVDRNPMALELARMALWLEAYTPDRALGFLDHHLVCGDALLGLLELGVVKGGIPDEAFKAITGDDKEVARMLTKLNRAGRKALEERQKRGQLALGLGTQSLAEAFAQLDSLGDHAVEGVAAKRARWAALRHEAEASPLSLAADMFISAFLMPKRLAPGEQALREQQATGRFPTTATLGMALDGTLAPSHPVAQAARSACAESRVLHWPLVFPQVFARGGFDVVIGNPPWEKFTISEEEWFASRASEIAAIPSKSRRRVLIRDLERGSPALYSAWQAAQREAEVLKAALSRKSRLYPLTGFGEQNTYHLFTERSYGILRPEGRCGMVVKTGIGSAKNCLPLFTELTQTHKLVSLFDFVNAKRLFPAVQTVERFCLITIQGTARASSDIALATLCQDVEDLREPGRVYHLSPDDIALMSPVNGACPLLQSEADAEIMRKVYRAFPVLALKDRQRAERHWNVRYSALFHMSNDSASFRRKEELEHEGAEMTSGAGFRCARQTYLPLGEGKYIYHFDHRFGTFESVPASKRFGRKATAPSPTADQLRDPHYEIVPRYWISEEAWTARRQQLGMSLQYQLHIRDVAGAYPDLRTAIAAICPAGPAGDKAPVLILDGEGASAAIARRYLAFAALFCSMPFDYIVRNKLFSKSLKWNTLGQVPMPTPAHVFGDARSGGSLGAALVQVALELTYVTHSLRSIGEPLGVPGPYTFDADRRWSLMRIADAVSAHLFTLERAELVHVLSSFRTLARWEQRVVGEYATAIAVLAAFDNIARQLNEVGRLDLALIGGSLGPSIVYDADEAEEDDADETEDAELSPSE